MNTVIICGMERVSNINGKLIDSDTFLNNALSYRKIHKNETIKVVDARGFVADEFPITNLWNAVAACFSGGIDKLIYEGHSSPNVLAVFSKCRNDLDDEERFLTKNHGFMLNLNDNAKIYLHGCQAGGTRGKKSTDSIAQTIADRTRRFVYAYTSKTSQQKTPEGYKQVPDVRGYAEFIPRMF